METKYKIDDTLFFLGDRELFEGKVKLINILISRGLGTSIIYTVETYNGEQKVLEKDLFKSRIECAMSLVVDCVEKLKIEFPDEENIKYVVKVGKEVFNGNL